MKHLAFHYESQQTTVTNGPVDLPCCQRWGEEQPSKMSMWIYSDQFKVETSALLLSHQTQQMLSRGTGDQTCTSKTLLEHKRGSYITGL